MRSAFMKEVFVLPLIVLGVYLLQYLFRGPEDNKQPPRPQPPPRPPLREQPAPVLLELAPAPAAPPTARAPAPIPAMPARPTLPPPPPEPTHDRLGHVNTPAILAPSQRNTTTPVLNDL